MSNLNRLPQDTINIIKTMVYWVMLKRLLSEKSELEKKLDNINHIMELIRTIVPLLLLVLNTIIILKIFDFI